MLSGKKQLKQTIAGHLKAHSSQRIRLSDLPLTKPENKTADKESEKKKPRKQKGNTLRLPCVSGSQLAKCGATGKPPVKSA